MHEHIHVQFSSVKNSSIYKTCLYKDTSASTRLLRYDYDTYATYHKESFI